MNNKQLAEALRAINLDALPINDVAAVLNAAEALEIGEAQPVTDERAAFEAWFKSISNFSLAYSKPRSVYLHLPAHSSWLAWQARAALSAAAGDDKRDVAELKRLRSFVTGLSVPTHPDRDVWLQFIDAAIAAASKGVLS